MGKGMSEGGDCRRHLQCLRGTAVTRLALVRCTEAEIATITGHSLRDVRSILDAHYLHRDIEIARAAATELEMVYAMRVVKAKSGTSK